MKTIRQAADLPDAFTSDLVPLDAEIAALEALQQGLDEVVALLLSDEADHRIHIERLNVTEFEPKTLDFMHGSDWHAAHAEWERRAIERKEKLGRLNEERERAQRTYTEFVHWIVRPAGARLEQLRAKRSKIVEARIGIFDDAMKAARKGAAR